MLVGRPTGGDANKSCHYVDAGVVISSGAMSSATWRCGVGLSANVNVLSGVVCQRVCVLRPSGDGRDAAWKIDWASVMQAARV